MAGDRFRSHGKQLGTHGTGKFIMLFEELRASPPYKLLTPTGKLILIDMLGVERRASNGGKQPVPDGFQYTWETCSETVSQKTFYSVVHRILDLGFFARPPGVLDLQPGAPRRFIGSTDWKHYKPTGDEVSRLQQRGSRKKARLTRDKKRRTDYRVKKG